MNCVHISVIFLTKRTFYYRVCRLTVPISLGSRNSFIVKRMFFVKRRVTRLVKTLANVMLCVCVSACVRAFASMRGCMRACVYLRTGLA